MPMPLQCSAWPCCLQTYGLQCRVSPNEYLRVWRGNVQSPGSRSGGMGVYVGISYNEYGPLVAATTPAISAYTATGSSLSVAAGMQLA